MIRLVVVGIIMAVILGCSSPLDRGPEWDTRVPSVQDFLERSEPPPELEENARPLWRKAVAAGYMEIARLSQTAADISFLPRVENEEEAKEMIDQMPGEEVHKAALAFWLVQEIHPEVLYAVGVRTSDLESGFVQVYRRLVGADGQPLGYFGQEEDFAPFIFIYWNRESGQFEMGVDPGVIQQIADAAPTAPIL